MKTILALFYIQHKIYYHFQRNVIRICLQEFHLLISHCKPSRSSALSKGAIKRKAHLGQFFTPKTIAQFMAGMFSSQTRDICRILDPGAGMGSLFTAFLERWIAGELHFQHMEVDAFEIDKELARVFAKATAGLVFVTAFPNRVVMARYLGEIAWETDVWVAESPSHLIHFNGDRFLGPYPKSSDYK